jgi:hypothetical protein
VSVGDLQALVCSVSLGQLLGLCLCGRLRSRRVILGLRGVLGRAGMACTVSYSVCVVVWLHAISALCFIGLQQGKGEHRAFSAVFQSFRVATAFPVIGALPG